MSKKSLVTAIASSSGHSQRIVREVLAALPAAIQEEITSAGKAEVPGIVRLTQKTRPARAAREGTNPLTRQPVTIAAKPETKYVRARVVKSVSASFQG